MREGPADFRLGQIKKQLKFEMSKKPKIPAYLKKINHSKDWTENLKSSLEKKSLLIAECYDWAGPCTVVKDELFNRLFLNYSHKYDISFLSVNVSQLLDTCAAEKEKAPKDPEETEEIDTLAEVEKKMDDHISPEHFVPMFQKMKGKSQPHFLIYLAGKLKRKLESLDTPKLETSVLTLLKGMEEGDFDREITDEKSEDEKKSETVAEGEQKNVEKTDVKEESEKKDETETERPKVEEEQPEEVEEEGEVDMPKEAEKEGEVVQEEVKGEEVKKEEGEDEKKESEIPKKEEENPKDDGTKEETPTNVKTESPKDEEKKDEEKAEEPTKEEEPKKEDEKKEEPAKEEETKKEEEEKKPEEIPVEENITTEEQIPVEDVQPAKEEKQEEKPQEEPKKEEG